MARMMALMVPLFATHAVTEPSMNETAVDRMRRLQDPFPPACIEVCPGASTFYDEMLAMPEDVTIRRRVNLMCSHDDTVRCMSRGGAGFSACQNIALNQGRPTGLDEVECHCNFCTSIMDRIIESTEALEGMEDSTAERLPFLCQQVGLDACFLDNPEQCLWAVDSLGFNELPTAEQCRTEGHATASFDVSSSAHSALLGLVTKAVVVAFAVAMLL